MTAVLSSGHLRTSAINVLTILTFYAWNSLMRKTVKSLYISSMLLLLGNQEGFIDMDHWSEQQIRHVLARKHSVLALRQQQYFFFFINTVFWQTRKWNGPFLFELNDVWRISILNQLHTLVCWETPSVSKIVGSTS